MIFIMFAALLSLLGTLILWRCWLRPRRFWPGLALGWGLICAAAPLWAAQFGADRGAALSVLAVSGSGLIITGLTNRWNGPADPAGGDGALPRPTWRWLGVFLLAGPVGFGLSTAAELLYADHGLGGESDRLVFGTLILVPLLWGAMMILASVDWRRRFVAALLHSHSVLGLTFSAVLYLVCLSGAAAVFNHDIDHWEESGFPSYSRMEPEAIDRAGRAAMQAVPGAPRLFIVLPTETSPHTTVLAGGKAWRADQQGALLGPPPEGWGDFVTEMHVRLHVPGALGLSLVGLSGVGMTALILSGLLAHPRLFRDAFRWRRGGTLRVSQADLHNRVGVWGAPLFLALALTGAFLGLANMLVTINAKTLYGGDMALANRPLFGTPGPASDDAAPLVDVIGPLREIESLHPDFTPHYVEVGAPGTSGQRVHLYFVPPRRLAYSERFDFDEENHLAGTLGMAEGELGRQAFASTYALHFGSFGGVPVRILYFLFGIGAAVVCAGGVDIWLTRARISGWPARLWPGIAWGSPALLALTAATVPSPTLFWGGLAALLALLGFAKDWQPLRIRAALQAATALLLIAVTIVHAVKSGAAPSLVDAGLLAIASIILSGLRFLFQSREIVTD